MQRRRKKKVYLRKRKEKTQRVIAKERKYKQCATITVAKNNKKEN